MSKLMVMVGLPASGKSTYAKKIAIEENAIILSSDKLREELYGDINDSEHNTEVFSELHRRIKENLEQGKNVIWDSTNINYKKRQAFLKELKRLDITKECHLMATPYELCIKQNKQRDRQVPEDVIRRMYKNIYVPQMYEGFNEINIVYNTGDMIFDVNELFNGENGLNKINQDNPHHTLTIGGHCLKCASICEELKDDFQLNMASLYHDIGKRFTKEFKNAKGESTDIAHYYQHHLISAYDSLFYLKGLEQEDLLEIVKYITWHMQPFNLNTEKAKNKFIKLVGQEFYNNLLILHEADINSK